MNRSSLFPLFAATCAAVTIVIASACDDSSGAPSDNGAPTLDSGITAQTDTGTPDTGVVILPDGNVVQADATPPPNTDCFTSPTTHFEIINACTNAQKVDKHPNLPLLLPDGGLPLP
jgi:hypothetical protein